MNDFLVGAYSSRQKIIFRSGQFYNRLCRDVYFKNYLPGPDDTVVDVGAGYGHEALYVHSHSPGVRYVSVEAQPSVYECLANTLAPYRPRMTASPLAIADVPALWLSSVVKYEMVSTSGGCVEVPAITWKVFCRRYQIDRIALLKMNIEGGETALLQSIGDMSLIDRAIIGTHDFLDDRKSEYYRTEAFVTIYLKEHGFKVTPFQILRPLGWIYAQRLLVNLTLG